jgi:polysaccharide export outer membrane protein
MSRILILLGCVLLAGCAHREYLTSPNITRVEGTELPAPTKADLSAFERPYYVGPFDELYIDVFGIKEMSEREVQVDASGRLSFPLVGTLEVNGKTPGEIAGLIEAGLRGKYIRDPHATVNLKKTVSQVVTIEGEVEKPGLYPVIGRMSLMRAIATAEGTTEYSSLNDVVVFRQVNGRTYAALYNLTSIRRGLYSDPEIFANDIVQVGDSRGRRLFKDLLAVVPLLTTPLIIALQN